MPSVLRWQAHFLTVHRCSAAVIPLWLLAHTWWMPSGTELAKKDLFTATDIPVARKTSTHVPLGLCGDVEQNPGPRCPLPPSPLDGNFQLHPMWLRAISIRLGNPPFDLDVFADPARTQCARWWSPLQNAFLQSWEKQGMLWINPPWHLLDGVVDKFLDAPVPALVLAPIWDCPWFWTLLSLAYTVLPLPAVGLYRRWPTSPTLSAPPWRTCAFWLRDLTHDGDVESNPGPSPTPDPPTAFRHFWDTAFDEFSGAIPSMDLARKMLQLKDRIAQLPDGYEIGLSDLKAFLGSIDGDFLRVVAAFELYCQCTFQFDNNGTWALRPDISPLEVELNTLRQQLAAMQGSPPRPELSFDSLRPLCKENLDRFGPLPHKPSWMKDICAVLLNSLPSQHVAPPALQNIWEVVLQYHFKYASAYPRNHATTKQRSASLPMTLDEAISKGGTVVSERTNRGFCSFLDLDGKRYYISQAGRLLDSSLPPPGNCDQCGQLHWHWQCQGPMPSSSTSAFRGPWPPNGRQASSPQ